MRLLAEFQQTLNLGRVSLIHSDWGGGLHLTADGLDQGVGRMIISITDPDAPAA